MNPLNLISDYLDRAKSHIYGLFLFWIIVEHLPVIYTAMFVDQNLIYKKSGMLKTEYIWDKYYNFPSDWFWLLYIIIVISFACFMTWLMIWILPKSIVKRAYARELDDQYQREEMKIEREQQLTKKRESLTVKQEQLVEQKQEVAKKERDLGTLEERRWQKELRNINVQGRKAVDAAIEIIYGSDNGYYGDLLVDPGVLAYLETNNLVTVDRSRKRIEPTDKGKYYINQLQINKIMRG